MSNSEELKQQVNDLVGAGRTGKALEMLNKMSLPALNKEVTLLNSRFRKLKEEQSFGTIDGDEARKETNQINRSIIELLEKIGEAPTSSLNSPSSITDKKAYNKLWPVAIVLLAVLAIANYFFATMSKEKQEDLSTDGTFIDSRDGKSYSWIKLKDGKKWMSQNLNYNADDSYYAQGKPANGETFGRLYTWSDALEFCPSGWHLPTEDEWKAMIAKYGGLGKYSYKKITTNNFSANLGGMRSEGGDFSDFGEVGRYWCATESSQNADAARYFYLRNNDITDIENGNKNHAFSCRCIKD